VISIHQRFNYRKEALELEIGEALTIDGIAGPLRIFQRVNGHRHSIDDAATAWYALKTNPSAKEALDLGTGIGSVGIAVLWGLSSTATLVCIEAQQISFSLLSENIKLNGLEDRITSMHGDLRGLSLSKKFDLITASPPYFRTGTGVLPADSQKAYARFELRGNVADYAEIAKRHLTSDGTFVFCFPYQQKQRCISLVENVGFGFVTVQDVFPHANKPPLFSLFAARLDYRDCTFHEPPLIVAGPDGRYTEQMLDIQRIRGFGNLGENSI